MPEAVVTNESPITLINPSDADQLNELALNLTNPSISLFWEDGMRVWPALTFKRLFMTPQSSIAFDVGQGHGVIVIRKSSPGHRGHMIGASWGRRAMGRHLRTPRRQAFAAAMIALDLTIIEAVTREDNTRAKRAMISTGMRHVAFIPNALWYNKQQYGGDVYEIRRDDLDLPPVKPQD